MIKIKEATNQEWDELVNSDENSTYFHTREWYDIWAEYNPNFKNDAKLIELWREEL